jgi:carboxypeptidase family protein
MRRGWGIGVGAGLLVLLLWLVWRPGTSPESTSRATGPSRRPQAVTPAAPLLWSSATPSEPRGTLSIQGRVVGPWGPVPGAVVVALAPREWPGLAPLQKARREWLLSPCELSGDALPLLDLAAELRGRQMPLARATTDAQGNFRLEGLEGGAFALWAESGEGIGLRAEVAAGSADVEVRLGPGRTFSGTVYDEQGRPVAGALVTTLQRDAGRFVEASTNDEGRFLLGPLPWGRYDVLVSKAGLVPVRLTPDMLERAPVQVTLPAPRRLSGQVVDARGAVPGVTVQVEGGTRVAPVVTDVKGHFRLEGLCPGRYVLTASHAERYARQEVAVGRRAAPLGGGGGAHHPGLRRGAVLPAGHPPRSTGKSWSCPPRAKSPSPSCPSGACTTISPKPVIQRPRCWRMASCCWRMASRSWAMSARAWVFWASVSTVSVSL